MITEFHAMISALNDNFWVEIQGSCDAEGTRRLVSQTLHLEPCDILRKVRANGRHLARDSSNEVKVSD